MTEDQQVEQLEGFKADLTTLINSHGLESRSDTPDWVLAEYLIQALLNFEQRTNQVREFFERDPEPAEE